MSQDREPGWQRPDDEARPDATALGTHRADLIAYCRAVTGRESAAVSTADAVLDYAQFLLSEPNQLRAWLFALARVELLAGSEPQPLEIFDLVHRYGIRPEDLPTVLGVPPAEVDQLLAAAEAEYGDGPGWDDRPGWDDSTHLIEGQPDLAAIGSVGQLLDTQLSSLLSYCRALTSREEDAVSTAHYVLGSSRSLLTDPDQRRAWLFALARQEMLGDAAPVAAEVLDLVHRHGIRAGDLPTVLGISPAEADQLLSEAEDEYASSAFGSAHQQADSRPSEAWHDDRSWDDRAAAWDRSAADPDEGADWDDGAGWDDSADWDDVFGPKTHFLPDLYGRFRKPPELAGRHAAPTSGGGRLRRAFARGPVRVAAATAIVVAVIGIGAAYLAAVNSPPPSQASQQAKHHPVTVTQSPANTPSPAPTASPTQSPAPSQPAAVVQPPAPAPTSTKPKPSATPTSPTPTSPTPTSPTPTSPTPTSPTPTTT